MMSITKGLDIGFSRLKPAISRSTSVVTQLLGNKSIPSIYKDYIRSRGPYEFFLTLTFGRYVNFNKRCQFTNFFLHVYNQEIFTRKYRERNHFHDGFAFFEEHKSEELKDKPHIHFLLAYHPRYDEHDIWWHEERFFKAASKVKDGKGRQVFNPYAIDLRYFGDNRRVGYCTKEIWDKNISNVKLLCLDGLSDNQRVDSFCYF
jgi:hypothetical protein